ncbi:hypothetical protein FN846DRAFT_724172 [Sphaerosporella brunnea]|uniref:RlpA-like protein double-psi beta-barrel domain-containing protein n=1 Tax=Sphaerosporella brunnea TaxID=1250544 RepID=A0A5J5EXU7_9PEZI|nr:hypothetical protein FN846DRAFT_724172 [Sphaerosporella brunnea]
MVRRISEFKQKLHPNEKLRAWYASHTFGGTTKARNLKILGFSKTNFYYIAGAIGCLVVIAAAVVGIGLKNSFRKATQKGAQQGLPGQNIVQSSTQTRIRTLYSNGETILSTETTAFLTTIQNGGGTTQVKTTNDQGQETTLQASLSLFTNSKGDIETSTYIGTSFFVTNSKGYSEQTFIYGTPTILTKDGQAITTTMFDGLSVSTDEQGQTVISYSTPTPTPGATLTGENSASATGSRTTDGTTDASSTDATATSSTQPTATTATTNNPAQSSKSSSSSSPTAATSTTSGGGGGGEEFEGEATFYAPGLGSCGTDATDADFVAALSKILFDATGATNSNNNPYCGRKALVKAANKRRRWENAGNITQEGLLLERTRFGRLSRRSLVSIAKDIPTPSRNDSGIKPEVVLDGPPRPGITPPPEVGPQRRQAGGGGVTITIVDRCPVCKQYDLDLSPAAYNVLGNPDAGRIPIVWSWLN